MKQLLLKHTFNANYGGATSYQPVSGATSQAGTWLATTYAGGATPWSCPGVFRNLSVVLPNGPNAYDMTFTLYHAAAGSLTGLATAMTVTILAGALGPSSDLTHEVTVAAGDTVAIQLAGTIQGQGRQVALALEFEGSTSKQSGYAIATFEGLINAGDQRYGGAFGNGEFSGYSAGTKSNSYSIASCAGNVTRIDAVAWQGAPAVGSTWTTQLVLNTVVQDGSGGTVNTTATLTSSGNTATSAFTLPIVPTDHVDLLVTRTGATAGSHGTHVACSVAFVATTTGQFQICGGSNNTISNTVVNYQWPLSDQSLTNELDALVRVGPTGVSALGLYTERSASPGMGKSWTHTLRKNATDTTITAVTADSATTSTVTSTVVLVNGDTLALSITPAGTPTLSQLHWGLALSSATTPPNPPTVTQHVLRRVRRFPFPAQGNKMMFLSRVEFLIQAGEGLTPGAASDPPVLGSDPIIMFRLSRDGGQTWGQELQMGIGRQGAYTYRAFLNRLGRGRNLVGEVSCTDPIPLAFLDCVADMESGTS